MFVDFCDPQNQFPPNGFGLEELNWKVIENELRIEINDLSDADLINCSFEFVNLVVTKNI